MRNVEFIRHAGACLVSRNVLSGKGRVRWMVRVRSAVPQDNGWRIFSHIDTEDYLADPGNLQITDFNDVCNIEPALIGIYDLPVGSDLQIVTANGRIQIVETATGREITEDDMYIPGMPERTWGDATPGYRGPGA